MRGYTIIKISMIQTAQKEVISRMKKYIALIMALLLALSLAGCARKENAVLQETKVYQVQSPIHTLRIRINAADFTVVHGNSFSVESNLKNLSVSDKNGVLTILDKTKSAVTYTNAALTVYIPRDAVFEEVDITTGAAKMTVDTMTAKSLELELGAGDARLESLNVFSKADIQGGAGQITIAGGTINNLDLKMGMGELNLTAALLGESELTLGIGESNLTLVGRADNYSIDIEQGIGSVTFDGKTAPDFNIGKGQNQVKIEGGVGAINLSFQEFAAPVTM